MPNHPDCLFCKIIAGEIPGSIVYEDDDILAFKDINPAAPVHILVIPKQHIAKLSDLQDEHRQIAGKLLLTIPRIAHDLGLEQDGFRVVANNGPNALQTVFHIHFHLLGGKKMGWTPA